MSAYQLRLQMAETRISTSRTPSSSSPSPDQGFGWIKDAYVINPPMVLASPGKQPESLSLSSKFTAEEDFDWIKTSYDVEVSSPSNNDAF